MLSRQYTIKELASIVSAEINGNLPFPDQMIDRVASDSRYKGLGPTTCFIAIESDRNDGHQFVKDAYNKGCRCMVVSKALNNADLPGVALLMVKDTMKALHDLAIFHRNEIDYPIVGITGSNGKTVVKEWLFQLLSSRKHVFRSPKSYNSQIGVPLSMIMMPSKADIGMIEAGISMKGEMEKLEKIVRPDLGILTNIHSAHLENFTDSSEIVQEKMKLFIGCKALIYRKDYKEIDRQARKLADANGMKLLDWSAEASLNPGIAVSWVSKGDHSVISVSLDNTRLEAEIPFRDKASIENAVHCLIASVYFGIDQQTIASVLSNLPSVAMRLQQLQGINNCTLVNDTYNSDLTSLEIALNFLNMQRQHKKMTLIISDIFQSGIDAGELYRKVNQMCVENGVDRVIGVGKSIGEQAASFTLPFVSFNTTENLLDDLKSLSFFNESILIKGSRKFGFERISNQLEFKKHETTLEVNLSALIDNLNFFKSKLNTNVGLVAMVKAFSYGTGSYEIANVLEHYGVNYLTVAYIDEGITLRSHGINSPIIVMNPSIGELQEMFRYNLEPEVYNLRDLYVIDDFTRQTKQSLSIHVKVETGMHRLGIEAEEKSALVEILKNNQLIQVRSVFSHLVGSDNAALDNFTEAQVRKYEDFCDHLKANGIRDFKRHMLNSDGILRFGKLQYDMVRLGIGLYGISSIGEYRKQLRSVACLKSRVSQIKTVPKGESVGYGRNFVAEKEVKIATVAIGYADGLVRKLGNGNWHFTIKGKKAPIIGNVCMDMTMVDITGIEGVREKDEVIIFEGNDDIYELAEKRETIAYEILTSISERVKRIFFYGD